MSAPHGRSEGALPTVRLAGRTGAVGARQSAGTASGPTLPLGESSAARRVVQ
ncbi:hypothetical protein GALL_360750 [mine drainage metagenome]|jgi:hypothetical protein|uniref:Uncharacterized protein n=1 Tax=mine drainage metagenome TaxID=410659 RepID=A0A1J5QFC3_9ZZZZ